MDSSTKIEDDLYTREKRKPDPEPEPEPEPEPVVLGINNRVISERYKQTKASPQVTEVTSRVDSFEGNTTGESDAEINRESDVEISNRESDVEISNTESDVEISSDSDSENGYRQKVSRSRNPFSTYIKAASAAYQKVMGFTSRQQVDPFAQNMAKYKAVKDGWSELTTYSKLRTIEEINQIKKSGNYRRFLNRLLLPENRAFYLDIDIFPPYGDLPYDDFVNDYGLTPLGIFTVIRIIDTMRGDVNPPEFDVFFQTINHRDIIDGLFLAIRYINNPNPETNPVPDHTLQMYIYMTLQSFHPLQVIEDPSFDRDDFNDFLRTPLDFQTVDAIDGAPPPGGPPDPEPVLAVGAFTPYNEIFHVSRCYDKTELGYQDSRLYVSYLDRTVDPLSLIGGRTTNDIIPLDLIYTNAFQFNYDFTYLKQHFMKKIVYYTCAIVIGLRSSNPVVTGNLDYIIGMIEMYNDLYFILRGLTETSGLLTYKLDDFTLTKMYLFFIFIDQKVIERNEPIGIGIISRRIIETFFNLLFRDNPQNINLCRSSIRCIDFIQNTMELNGPDIDNINSIDCMTLPPDLQAEINRPHYLIDQKALDILKTPLYSSYFVTAKNIDNDTTINDSKEILCDCNSLLKFQCLLAFVHAYVAHNALPRLSPPGTPMSLGPDHDPPNPDDDPRNFNRYLMRLYESGQLMINDDFWPHIEEIFGSYVLVGIEGEEARAAREEEENGEQMVRGGRGKSRRRIKMSKRNKPIKIYTKNKNNKKTKTRKLKGKKRTRKLKGKKRTLKKRRNKTNKRHK
uniref:Uncharacterized protein n=1 Tax=viral metagenome TaxID=1070528 RepID=A0A6C0DYI1_9ZZZZ